MKLWGGMILRAGITWGIVAVLLTILGAVLSPALPQVDTLQLGTYALLMAGVHYAAKARSDLLQSGIGGGLAGIVVAIFLILIRYIPVLALPTPPGAPLDLITALVAGFVAGAAGGLGHQIITR